MGFPSFYNLNHGRNEAHRPLDDRPDGRMNGRTDKGKSHMVKSHGRVWIVAELTMGNHRQICVLSGMWCYHSRVVSRAFIYVSYL
jgi:hypothetical protein